MPLPLPHTSGCLVCGRDNPHGLHLDFTVAPASGIVQVQFIPESHHIGFTGIAHGGILATVFDEAMVWAATWSGKRFCVCGELTVRFRRSALIGVPLTVEAQITNLRPHLRPRLIQSTATARDASGNLIAEATGKYVPMPIETHQQVVATLVPDAQTQTTACALGISK
jgi:acyl-coenzyme A thioesterase PaaI-like protein